MFEHTHLFIYFESILERCNGPLTHYSTMLMCMIGRQKCVFFYSQYENADDD